MHGALVKVRQRMMQCFVRYYAQAATPFDARVNLRDGDTRPVLAVSTFAA
jgi:hypothetical protein